jgi:hypothetical protein
LNLLRGYLRAKVAVKLDEQGASASTKTSRQRSALGAGGADIGAIPLPSPPHQA